MWRFVFLAFATLLFASAADCKVVDQSGKNDAETKFLHRLSTAIEQHGLDVRLGVPSPETESTLRGRPQVAPLRTLPASIVTKKEDLMGFAQLFMTTVRYNELGIDTVLVAVDAPDRSSEVSQDEFESLWQSVEPEKRVFVSFTKADAEHAIVVRSALEQQGFVVFTYIAPGEDRPWTNSIDVARYFQQSGIRLVVDTDNARKSLGTQVERATDLALSNNSLTSFLRKPDKLVELDLVIATHPGGDAGGGGCCKWCRRAPNGAGRSTIAPGCETAFSGTSSADACGTIQCGGFCKNAISPS